MPKPLFRIGMGWPFGGINNSAVKTVVKAVWEQWGQAAAAKLLEESLVTDMPIGAFQAVRQGQARYRSGSLPLCPPGGRPGDLSPRPPGGAGTDPLLFLCPHFCTGVGGPPGGGSISSPVSFAISMQPMGI